VETQWSVWGVHRDKQPGLTSQRWFHIRPRLNLTLEYENFRESDYSSWREFLMDRYWSIIMEYMQSLFVNEISGGADDWDFDFNKSTFFNQQIILMSRDFWFNPTQKL
jgi:hypothetical protein